MEQLDLRRIFAIKMLERMCVYQAREPSRSSGAWTLENLISVRLFQASFSSLS